jgi:predicted RNase H-like HicB family nuclease
MRNINFKNVVWKEGRYYVAWNLNTAISSFGKTRKDALKCLKEALELHFEDASSQEIGKVERPDLVPFDLKYA